LYGQLKLDAFFLLSFLLKMNHSLSILTFFHQYSDDEIYGTYPALLNNVENVGASRKWLKVSQICCFFSFYIIML